MELDQKQTRNRLTARDRRKIRWILLRHHRPQVRATQGGRLGDASKLLRQERYANLLPTVPEYEQTDLAVVP